MFSFKKHLLVALSTSAIAATAAVNPITTASAAPATSASTLVSASAVKTPKRIVSLSPSATEILWGIGAAKQVVAVDDNSNFPVGVPTTKLSSFTPNVEAIAGYSPDLVVLNATATKATQVAAALKQLHIRVYLEKSPNSVVQAYTEFADLGKLTGHKARAAKLVASMKTKIADAVSTLGGRKVRTFIELDNTLYSATSKTVLGGVLTDLGALNIADAAAGSDKTGYPQLTTEYLVSANPQLVLLTDAAWGESKATVSAREGWAGVDAVKNGKIFALNADVASRWGPRLVNLYRAVGKALARVN